MSAEATAYVTQLRKCPDGADVTSQHKALLWCLADHHNRSTRRCDPSILLLADEARLSESSVKRALAYLEDHGVIEQRHPQQQGRGHYCSYVFLFLDDPERLKAKLSRLSKGVQGEPLFCPPQRGPEGVQENGERGSKGVQILSANKEVEPVTKGNQGTITPDGALKVWLRVKAQLADRYGTEETKLWINPARLQRVIDGKHMLIALPPSGRIIKAAYTRRQILLELLAPAGYTASFVKYADAYDKEEAQRRFGIEVQGYGQRPGTHPE